MPLYIYRCSICEREVEELQKMGADEPPTVDCPEGGSCDMSKVVTSIGFRFIGEGWGGWVGDANGFLQKQTLHKTTSLAPKKKRKAGSKV